MPACWLGESRIDNLTRNVRRKVEEILPNKYYSDFLKEHQKKQNLDPPVFSIKYLL